jgi:hypothetical protein
MLVVVAVEQMLQHQLDLVVKVVVVQEELQTLQIR